MSRVAPTLRLIAGLSILTIILFASSTPSSAQGCLPGSLQRTLSQIRAKFGPVRIVSTFRRGAITRRAAPLIFTRPPASVPLSLPG